MEDCNYENPEEYYCNSDQEDGSNVREYIINYEMIIDDMYKKLKNILIEYSRRDPRLEYIDLSFLKKERGFKSDIKDNEVLKEVSEELMNCINNELINIPYDPSIKFYTGLTKFKIYYKLIGNIKRYFVY
jgi:hypothetical protein